jgi:hypothetical protein
MGKKPFTLADLVVACWDAEPWLFGLKGFEKTYPDSNKVSVALEGPRGLIKRGDIVRVGPGLFKRAS